MAASSSVPCRGRSFEGLVFIQPKNRLHRPFAKARLAHHQTRVVVLDRSGDDFAGRGRGSVDHHHGRHLVVNLAAGLAVEAVILAAQAPLGEDDEVVFFQEELAHTLGRVEQATGVETQVQDQALHTGRRQFVQLGAHFVLGRAGKVLDPDIADVTDHEAVGHAFNLDDVAGDGERQRVLHARTLDGDVDLGARLAAQQLHCLTTGEIPARFALDLDDLIATLDAHVVSGRAFDGRDHRREVIPDVDRDTQAAELSLGAHDQIFVIDRRQVIGVLVEVFEHAANGRLHDLFGVFLVHVIFDDPLVNLTHDLEVFVELLPAFCRIVGSIGHRGQSKNQQHRAKT